MIRDCLLSTLNEGFHIIPVCEGRCMLLNGVSSMTWCARVDYNIVVVRRRYHA